MSSPRLEAFLARLYTDEASLAAFIRAPADTARDAGLDDADVSAMVAADHIGLVMAAAARRSSARGATESLPVILGVVGSTLWMNRLFRNLHTAELVSIGRLRPQRRCDRAVQGRRRKLMPQRPPARHS